MRREHLKVARLALGLTALELGEKAAVSEEKVYQVERGRYRHTLDESVRWAKALGMSPSQAFPELFEPPAVTSLDGHSQREGEPHRQ